MNDMKLPIIYKFQCKRGNSFDERRLEVSENFFRYINPKNNEERIKAKIEDCILTEFSPNVPNTLRLASVSKAFNEVIIRHINGDIIKKFKSEFDLIKSQKKLLNKLEKIDIVLPKFSNVIKEEEFYEAKSSGEEENDLNPLNQKKVKDNSIRELEKKLNENDGNCYPNNNQITFEDNKRTSQENNTQDNQENSKNFESFRNMSISENTGRNSLENLNSTRQEDKLIEETPLKDEDHVIKIDYVDNLLSNNLSEKINQILEDKYYKFDFKPNSVIETNDNEFRTKYETQAFSTKLDENVSNLIEMMKRDINFYRMTVWILIVFNLIVVFFYSQYLTIIMGAVSIYMVIYSKHKTIPTTFTNTDLSLAASDSFNLSVKATAFLGCNDVKHVIYHLYNLEDYKEWNNSLEINKKKSNLFSYDYFEKDSQKYEISNLKRNFLCNQEQSKFLIVEYFDENNIYKVLVVELINQQKIKLVMYVNIHQAPKFYLKYFF